MKLFGNGFLVIGLSLLSVPIFAQDDDILIDKVTENREAGERTTPVIGGALQTRFEVVNELIDQNNLQAALDELKTLESQSKLRTGPFGEAVIFMMIGFVNGSLENLDEAIKYYEKALATEELPGPMHQGSLFSLAHIHAAKQEFEKALELMRELFLYEENPFASAYMFMGSCYAALERYDNALPFLERAIEEADRPIESWYQMTLSIQLSLGKFERALSTIKTMLEHWTRSPQYWEALVSVYQELGDEPAAFDALMTAYINGMVTRPDQIMLLAQMSVYNDVPFTAGSILENEMLAGVVPETEETLTVLIDTWIVAREYERAIAAVDRIVAYSDAGPHYLRAARLYFQAANWEGAAMSAEKALSTELENPVQALMVAGSAYSEMNEYEKALGAFTKVLAIGTEKERASAESWINYVEESRLNRDVLSAAQ